VPRTDAVPDGLIAGLADREASLWLRGNGEGKAELEALAAMLRLPWKQVFLEEASPKLLAAIESHDDEALIRRRGFIHIIDTDPSRIDLPARSLPIFLLSGRDGREPAFQQELRRMTMLEELRRSGARQLAIVGQGADIVPPAVAQVWATGFRSRLIVIDERDEAPEQLADWLAKNGEGPTSSVLALQPANFAAAITAAFLSVHREELLLVRQRDETGDLRQVDFTDVDDPERPLLENYDLIVERDFASGGPEDLPEDAFNNFFRGDFEDWRAYAAGLPWIRDDSAWRGLESQLRRIDASGSSENRIVYIMSEPGAGGTTLARHLAFTAARAGYPTLVAKRTPFAPAALPLVNFLTRARQRSDDCLRAHQPEQEPANEEEGRRYETPWLLVFDRVHWEFRDTELRRFLQQFERAGRPVCILVVTGPQREEAYFDDTKFKPLAELHHMLEENEALALGRHLNRFLRVYGKERAEWQWRNFYEAHSVRYLEGLAAFWITLAFWLQTQYDLSVSIQEWVYRAFNASADTPEIKHAVLQIAALSSERLPMPETLLDQNSGNWPIRLLLDDRRSALSPLGLVRLATGGRKYWALAHDLLGRLLINALFFDFQARNDLGFAEARDAQHLRFLILQQVSAKPALGELAERDYGEEFATTVFKIDPDHGRASWIHLWREVLAALDGMAAPLRNGSRVFRHHTAISRRRIAWLDEAAYGVTDPDRVALLKRAIEDIEYALQSIEAGVGDEPDINLYNSLANAYFDLARIRADQGAGNDELRELRQLASDATRHAYDENPSNPYVIETHVKSLLASSEEDPATAPSYCIEALEIVYGAIRNDRNELRRHALASLADRAVRILLQASAGDRSRREPDDAIEVLVSAWITLAKSLGGHAPAALDELPKKVLGETLTVLEHPAGAGNAQVAKLRYQVLVAAEPLNFELQLDALEILVSTDYRLTPQLRLEYALLLFQQMRTEEGNQEFRALRALWRETDVFVQLPDRLRWLFEPGGQRPRVVNAVAAYDFGHRAMARVRQFGRFDVPYRPQEFDVRAHPAGTVFSAIVSLGHNGPFLRPLGAYRR
jgi:hypothetical protein